MQLSSWLSALKPSFTPGLFRRSSRRLPRRWDGASQVCSERLEDRLLLTTLFAVDSSDRLFTVDANAGTVNVIGRMGVTMFDIAFNSAGELYGINSGSSLYRIDPSTAVATRIGAVGAALSGLQFSPNGTLFGSGSGLYSINVSTGAGTLVGSFGGIVSAGDLAFDSSGNLFLSTTSNQLARVNTTTGAATVIGSMGFSSVLGLALGDDGVLYGMSDTSQEVFSINTTTGQGTRTSSFSGKGANGVFGATVSPQNVTTSQFLVTNTNDSGPGSLRQAILDANSASDKNVIQFNIPGSGPRTIALQSMLPVITSPAVIDGRTQPGFSGTPLIVLSGANAGSSSDGIKITAGNSEVRGLVIGGFQQSGIVLATGGGNIIAGNYIGTDATGANPNGNDFGVKIEAGSTGNIIGTNGDGIGDAAEANLLSGNRADGVLIKETGTDRNVIAGNRIGTNPAGTAAVPNNYGVRIEFGAKSNRIGTDGNGVADAAERNVISGNRLGGMYITDAGTDSNVVAGNFVGVNNSGTANLPNAQSGIYVVNGARFNVIGTNGDGAGDAAERNLISGNNFDGIVLNGSSTSGNVIAGNFIGTDVTGAAALGGNHYGILIIEGANSNRVGTNADGVSDTLERNVVSGNLAFAIKISDPGSDSNVVAGNYLGVNAAGTASVGNAGSGVYITNGARRNIVGTNGDGTGDASEGNLISGNGFDGVAIQDAGSDFNVIAGNLIGTAADGTTLLGGNHYGIRITDGAGSNRVGTNADGVSDALERNIIAGNQWDGVMVSDASIGNRISGNSIYANGRLGIDLILDSGVTQNDSGDGDTGPNGLQNFPVLASASSTGGSTIINGSLSSTPNRQFRVEFFSSDVADPTGFGEGKTFLGATSVTTSAGGAASFQASLPVSVPNGHKISATAIDPDNNTSEFSQVITATSGTSTQSTTTTVTSTGTRSLGSPLTAAVSPATATGIVQFQVDGATFGLPVSVSGGTATLTTPVMAAGGHSVVAVFTSTSSSFASSTSAAATVNVTSGTATSTTTTVTSTGTQALGSPLTAAVSPSSAIGTVQFQVDGSAFGLPVSVSNGTAILSSPVLTAGSHSVVATFTPGSTAFAGSSSSLVVVTASSGTSQDPAITSSSTVTFITGSLGVFTVTTSGTPAPVLTQTGTLPSGVTFNAATGGLSGVPGPGTAGNYPLTFTASNGVGATANQNFTLIVTQANQAPAITSANAVNFTLGTPGTFSVTATGFPTPLLSQAGTLPAGVTFNAVTGTLSGVPAPGTTGSYAINFGASNGIGSAAVQNFTLTVNAPAFTAPPVAVTSIGSPLSQSVMFFTGGDGQIYQEIFDADQNIVSGPAVVQPGAGGIALVAATLPGGGPVLFALGADHQVYKATFDATGKLIGDFALTQAGRVQSIVATTDAAGSPLLLAIGGDNQIYFQRFDASGNQTAGYALTAAGGVRSISASGPVLFAHGFDNQVYQNRFNGTTWDGYNLPAAGAVQSFHFSAASGLLLAIGGDNQLYAQRIDASGNSPGGWFLTSPGGIQAVTQDLYSGKANVFVIGLDDQVYVQRFDADGNSLGYGVTSPGAVKSIVPSRLPGAPGIFAVGLDSQVYKLRFDNVTGFAIGDFSSANSGPVS